MAALQITVPLSAADGTLTIAPTPAPRVTLDVRQSDYLLSWTAVDPVFGLDAYEVRTGDSLETSTVVNRTNALSCTGAIDWVVERTFWVAAVDRAGNLGRQGSTAFAVPAPDSGTVAIDDAGNAVISFTTYTDPQIVGYELRVGPRFETGAFAATTQGSSFSVPLLAAVGQTYWVKGMYATGGYTLDSTRVDFLGEQLATPTSLSWRLTEPDMVFTWGAVAGAAQYFVLFEDGGVTSTKTTSVAEAAFHIPKYTATLRVIAVASNGNLSKFADLAISVSGRYNLNEVLSLALPITSGQYINLAFTTANTIKRASLRGLNPVAPYVQNINDGDLFAFGYNLSALPVSAIQGVAASWFRQGFWREAEGFFESGVIDLGAVYSGRLALTLTKTINYVGDAPVSAYSQVACEYLDQTTTKELVDPKAFLSARFQLATDSAQSATWTEAANGDWVTGRYVKLVVEVAMASPLTEITVTAGTITIDVPDITETGSKTGVTNAGAAVVFTKPFNAVSVVIATARGPAKAYTSGITAGGCTLFVDTATPTQVDYFVKGY